jgi:DNA-binding NarL/FixJ family response regulator
MPEKNVTVRAVMAEDFAPFRRFVVNILQPMAHLRIVAETGDGLDAVRKCAELQPDLVFLDIGLPTLSGIDAARQIRQINPFSRILFLTQEFDPDVVREACRLGASGYVAKIDAGSELLRAVASILNGERYASRTVRSVLGAAEG